MELMYDLILANWDILYHIYEVFEKTIRQHYQIC